MKTRTLILFWMALVLTALVSGGVMLRLLGHEEQRLALAWQESAREQGQWLADTVCLLVQQVEDELSGVLAQMPPENLPASLQALERAHPLVRNVFLVRGKETLLPDSSDALTREEGDFLVRYDALLKGTIPWQKPTKESDEGYMARRTRRGLLESFSRAKTKEASAFSADGASAHWLPWFYDEHLYLLGYVVADDEQLIYGVELEWTAVLSRIIPLIEQDGQGRYAFALEDGRGEVVHRTGAPGDVTGRAATVAVPVGDELPHWRIKVYDSERSFIPGAGVTRVVGWIMVVVLMAAIVGCGSLLFWLARRHMLDAQRKTGFVSNVSHELKTPLTTIRMYAEMLGEGRITDEEKKQTYLAVIIEQSQRLTRLVNNVLDFSRLEQRRKKYNLEPLDIADEVKTLLEEQRPRLEQAGMALKVDLPDASVPRTMDRDVLQQALLNLIDNAIKYAGEGGELLVAWRPYGALAVCDRGPGIPEGQRERVFQSFQRLDDSLTARQAGCGLGLSIARQLLRDLGGGLLYEPRTGGGACFVIVLPREAVS